MAQTAPTRTNVNVFSKDILLLIEKVDGSGTYIPFGCMSSVDYESAGADVEEIVCRAGIERAPSGTIPPPSLSLEHVVRQYPSAEVANNVTDEDIQDWNDAATIKKLKYVKGNQAGDTVYSGSGFFSGFSRKAPGKGVATGSAKFNFTSVPTKSVLS